MKSYAIILLVALFLVGKANSFFQRGPRATVLRSITASIQPKFISRFELSARKKDLFSDDLFDNESEDEVDNKPKSVEKVESPKQKYLDEKWKLNTEDAKDFKGFPGRQMVDKPTKDGDDDGLSKSVPCFALMYKFRREYMETGTESVVADHKGYCTKFNKILSTEVLNLGKAKGVVVLWAGFQETTTDESDTRDDIMKFLEDDPLVVKDIVENWDIIDLTPPSVKETYKTNILPAEVIKP